MGSCLLNIMLHIVEEDPGGCALKQDVARTLRLRDGNTKDHESDEGTRCWVCIETLWRGGLPDDDGGDDDTDVVDGVADKMS